MQEDTNLAPGEEARLREALAAARDMLDRGWLPQPLRDVLLAEKLLSGRQAIGEPKAAHEPNEFALIVSAMAKAEGDRLLSFVALKFLRDSLLPREDQRLWKRTEECQRIVNDAVDAGVLVTGRIENPRNSQFPTTTVRLNRDHPEVKRLLSASE